jgi:hypothetical protein
MINHVVGFRSKSNGIVGKGYRSGAAYRRFVPVNLRDFSLDNQPSRVGPL